MGSGTAAPFGGLLIGYHPAGLTQEVVAERAGISARNVQNLERDVNRPLRHAARRLAEARWPCCTSLWYRYA
jgi:transcriptional regulator with XRE-family HTH domain